MIKQSNQLTSPSKRTDLTATNRKSISWGNFVTENNLKHNSRMLAKELNQIKTYRL